MYFDSKIIDSSWNTPVTSLGVKGKFLKGVDTLLVKESTGLFKSNTYVLFAYTLHNLGCTRIICSQSIARYLTSDNIGMIWGAHRLT